MTNKEWYDFFDSLTHEQRRLIEEKVDESYKDGYSDGSESGYETGYNDGVDDCDCDD